MSSLNGLQFIACDSKGTLHRGCRDIETAQLTYKEKWRVCAAHALLEAGLIPRT